VVFLRAEGKSGDRAPASKRGARRVDDLTMTRKPDDALEVVDSFHLTDADWAEINKLKRAYETGGMKALSMAMDELAAGDPIIALHVLGAFFPEKIRESIRDQMAEMGITAEDLREIIEKTEAASKGGSTSKH